MKTMSLRIYFDHLLGIRLLEERITQLLDACQIKKSDYNHLKQNQRTIIDLSDQLISRYEQFYKPESQHTLTPSTHS